MTYDLPAERFCSLLCWFTVNEDAIESGEAMEEDESAFGGFRILGHVVEHFVNQCPVCADVWAANATSYEVAVAV